MTPTLLPPDVSLALGEVRALVRTVQDANDADWHRALEVVLSRIEGLSRDDVNTYLFVAVIALSKDASPKG